MTTTKEFQLVDINKLVPYANNARTHNKEQILKLRSSLREFGFVNPVIIDKAYNVLAGHGRIEAAKEEGIADGVLALPTVSDDVKLSEEDLLITMTQMEGYVTEGDNTVTVVLDTNLTPELVEEGFVRELISKIQTMRKEAGFEVMDKISIYYHADEKVADIFNKYGNDIMGDVLGTEVVAEADSFDSGENGIYCKEWNINGEKVLLGVKKGEN